MKSYPVLDNLSHDGRDYAAGDAVDLSEEAAAPLIAAGVIDDKPGKPKAEAKQAEPKA